MSWVAAAVIGGAVVGAGASVYSSGKAADASQRGADTATGEQARQYNQTRADFAPQRALGVGAVNQLGRLYGFDTSTAATAPEQQQRLIGDEMLPADARLVSTDGGQDRYYDVYLGGKKIGSVQPGGSNGRFTPAAGVDVFQLNRQLQQQQQTAATPAGPDMSAFFESPDYQFNLAEGQKAIDRSLAARGRALSGAGVKEGERFASGLASQQFGDFTNRLLTIAGLGNAATSATAAAGANAANNNSAIIMNNANNRASSYMTAGQGVNNAVQGGVSNALLYKYLAPGTT